MRPGPRFTRAIAVLLASVALASCDSSPAVTQSVRSSNDTYGGLPSWLPRSTVPTNRIVEASARHPQLGIGGSTFKVSVAGGTVLVTMSGPETPPFVAPPPPTTRATFLITFARSTGPVPLRADDFGIIDGNGDVFYPKTFVGGGSVLVVPTNRTITVELSEVTATGTGSIAWAPDGRHPAVTWEYTLEND